MANPFDSLAPVLNDSPGEMWSNLGYWKRARNYSEASAALADLVIASAQITDGQNILELGGGFGDAAARILSRWQVSVASLNTSLLQTDTARERFPKPELKFLAEDATEFQRDKHGLKKFDRIISIDAIYFMGRRGRLLKKMRKNLRTGGIIAFTDLTLPRKRPAAWLIFIRGLILKAFGISWHDTMTRRVWTSKLNDWGFETLEIRSLRKAVFYPFALHLKLRRRRLRLRGPAIVKWQLYFTEKVLFFLDSFALMDYSLIVARKRKSDSPMAE